MLVWPVIKGHSAVLPAAVEGQHELTQDSVLHFPYSDRATKISQCDAGLPWHLFIMGCKHLNYVCGQIFQEKKWSFVQWVNLFLRTRLDLSLSVCSTVHVCPPVHDWSAGRLNAEREREREKKVLSRCLLWFMCIHYNTITVEVTQDMRDVLSTNT